MIGHGGGFRGLDGGFKIAEGDFAAGGENLADGFAGAAGDPFVGVDEAAAEQFGGEAAGGGLAAAAISDEDHCLQYIAAAGGWEAIGEAAFAVCTLLARL